MWKAPADFYISVILMNGCTLVEMVTHTHTHLHTFIWAVDSADQSVRIVVLIRACIEFPTGKPVLIVNDFCCCFLTSQRNSYWRSLQTGSEGKQFEHMGAEEFLLEDKNTPPAACLRNPVGLRCIAFWNCMWCFWHYWKVENTSDI